MESTEPIPVLFPLKGEWCAVNTPGHSVPSHGTDLLGQRYAYDFIQIDWNSKEKYKFCNIPTWKNLLFGVKLSDIYCWSQPIHAPFDGEVVEMGDGIEERNPVHVLRDLVVVLKNGIFFRAKNNKELHPLLGNYLILKMKDGVLALIAHARKGSILVVEGEKVKEGQQLAEVGHSGNSTGPHLHFQLMDNQELLEAKGLPCCFKSYELYEQGEWQTIKNGIPGKRERIRH